MIDDFGKIAWRNENGCGCGCVWKVDGPWTSKAQSSGCGCVWKDFSEHEQLLGLRNQKRRSHLYIWNWKRLPERWYLSCQHFRTNCKDLISVIQELKYVQKISMKLKELSILNKRLKDFKSVYSPQAQNHIANSWVKTAQIIHRSFLLIVLFSSDSLHHLLIE